MADSKGNGFPWAGVAVLAAFVGSTQLVPHAFEQLRPPEKERAQDTPNAKLEVDARLWEDPFVALRRFQAAQEKLFEKLKKQGGETTPCPLDLDGSQKPAALRGLLDDNKDADLSESLVVLAMVPGNPFVGAEEARRRLRYAVLAGLQAKGYVPDNAERIGLLNFDINLLKSGSKEVFTAEAKAVNTATPVARPASQIAGPEVSAETIRTRGCDPKNGNPPEKNEKDFKPPSTPGNRNFNVPFEMLTKQGSYRETDFVRETEYFEKVALLWVDETALPESKLDSLARMLYLMFLSPVESSESDKNKESPNCSARNDKTVPKLAVIGPSSTDALRTLVKDLRKASKDYPAFVDFSNMKALFERECGHPARQGYRLLAGAKILNAGSTAADGMLDVLNEQKVPGFLNEQFNRILGDKPPLKINFQRTITTDTELIKRLVKELHLRLPNEDKRRIVVVAERDSTYSQLLVKELAHRLKDSPHLTLKPFYFFRGIDGVTTLESGQDEKDKDKPRSRGKADIVLEWPESRDQLDYLRRQAQSLKSNDPQDADGPIGAIGIFGNDVHDKLLVLEALHYSFTDKVFFTTDLDARYLQPQVQKFTRNLIVASSLPLEFYQPRAGNLDLQAGTPPFRDVYQASTYLAARRAACRTSKCTDDEVAAAKSALDEPSVYEIGRNGAVPLGGYAFTERPVQAALARALVAGLIVLLMLGGLLIWPSTPTIKEVRSGFLNYPPPAASMTLPGILLIALYSALAAYVICSLIEFVNPRQVSFLQTLLLSVLSGFGALLAVMATLLTRQAPSSKAASGIDGLHAGLLLLVALAWVWVAWPGLSRPACIDCEPVTWLDGISAWPSHLIHLFALMVILCAMDFAWFKTLRRRKVDSDWLFLGLKETLPRRSMSRSKVRGLWREWLKRISIVNWKRRPGTSHRFLRLWLQYGSRGESGPRALRTAVMYGFTVLLIGALFFALNDGQVPMVPVRGAEHRQLVQATLYAILLLLPLLVAAVADATLLLFSFISHLNAGRTVYPISTIRHFSAAFGARDFKTWQLRFQALPEDRGFKGGPACHSLLDDWLDVQVVARRTELISGLVIGPFVVLALLVVARSSLFDNWSLTPAIAISVCIYLGWLIVLAALLKLAAENTRRRALSSMNADLQWLCGQKNAELAQLVEPFKRLIASVECNQTGAFAGLFDQPLLKALLVPLGGAGGTQLFERFLQVQ